MAFTDTERERIRAALRERLPSPVACPICKGEDVQIGQDPLMLATVDVCRVLPALALNCHSCGHVMPLSLGVLGLLDLVPGVSLPEPAPSPEAPPASRSMRC